MSGFSISGLASGIDTSSLVTQMMQINSMPQQLLTNQKTAAETQITAYQNINTKFRAVYNAAADLGLSGSFNGTAATASDPSVTAVSQYGVAQTGSLTFQLLNTATTSSSLSTARWTSTTDPFTLTNPIQIYDAENQAVQTVTVSPASGSGTPTMQDAINALNKASYTDSATGQVYQLSAGAVQTATGSWALQVNAESSGKAANFTLGSDFSQVSAGQDAQVQIGNSPTATVNPGYVVTSSSNAFNSLLPGVNVSVTGSTPTNRPITVNVAQDVSGLTTKMQTLVTALNSLHDEINADTGSGTNSDGTVVSDPTAPLSSDFQIQSMYTNVLETIGNLINTNDGSANPNGTAADVGITTDSTGLIKFDATTFQTAMQNNPSRVAALVTGTLANPGVAKALYNLADQYSNPVMGALAGLISGKNDTVTTLTTSIANWQVRLDDMRTNLTNQFNAMESALQTLQAQQQWMTSMFASSFGTSSSSSSGSSSKSSSISVNGGSSSS